MIRITTIVNDEAEPNVKAEHGLSVGIEMRRADGSSTSLLADAGQHAKTLRGNARQLGIDLSNVRHVVLSHGHYDHTGGLPALTEAGFAGDVVASPLCVRRRFSVATSGSMKKENGLPCPDALKRITTRWVDRPTEIEKGVTVFPLPQAAPPNRRLIDERGEPDTFPDEIFTLLDDGVHTVLLGGCTHHGVAQLLDYVCNTLGVAKIDAFVGGLHLVGHPTEEIEKAAEAALRHNVGRWIVGHCTGNEATETWAKRFANVERLMAGQSIEI